MTHGSFVSCQRRVFDSHREWKDRTVAIEYKLALTCPDCRTLKIASGSANDDDSGFAIHSVPSGFRLTRKSENK